MARRLSGITQYAGQALYTTDGHSAIAWPMHVVVTRRNCGVENPRFCKVKRASHACNLPTFVLTDSYGIPRERLIAPPQLVYSSIQVLRRVIDPFELPRLIGPLAGPALTLVLA